jgi:hypothetical protein
MADYKKGTYYQNAQARWCRLSDGKSKSQKSRVNRVLLHNF